MSEEQPEGLPTIPNTEQDLGEAQPIQTLQIEQNNLPQLQENYSDKTPETGLPPIEGIPPVQPTELNPVMPVDSFESAQDTQARSISPDHDIALQGPTIDNPDLVRASGEVAAADTDSGLIRAVNKLKQVFGITRKPTS